MSGVQMIAMSNDDTQRSKSSENEMVNGWGGERMVNASTQQNVVLLLYTTTLRIYNKHRNIFTYLNHFYTHTNKQYVQT